MRGSKSVFQLGLGQRKCQINSRHDQFRKEKANISLLQAGTTWKWEKIRAEAGVGRLQTVTPPIITLMKELCEKKKKNTNAEEPAQVV